MVAKPRVGPLAQESLLPFTKGSTCSPKVIPFFESFSLLLLLLEASLSHQKLLVKRWINSFLIQEGLSYVGSYARRQSYRER